MAILIELDVASAVIAVFVHVPIATFDSKCHSEVIACCRNDRQSVKKRACLGAVDELAARIVAMRIVSGHRFWIALASGLSAGCLTGALFARRLSLLRITLSARCPARLNSIESEQ